ncbi:MAG: GDSL-type esterase/lipase family protein [Lachnospiraceae bacterium]|nr:GDSL-type esterase/lipase family protein [Lachnospiraceae bacterium]MDD4524353.1 GDSL-type esterase/lipase family protein [Lachnospiraceae bacterium]
MSDVADYFKSQQAERVDKLRILNQYAREGQILFTGSSLMEQFPVEELLRDEQIDICIYNRGVSGFTTEDMLTNMEEMVFGCKPSKIFINIGTNDIGAKDYSEDRLIRNYREILTEIKYRLPEAVIYVMAYYPVNETEKMDNPIRRAKAFLNRNNANIHKANMRLEKMSEELGLRFINVNEGLSDENGKLRKEYTLEGIHMYANAYRIILHNMMQYILE